ncbi:MAG: hypothetical protein ACRYG7_06985 [Janthinobacterium lividum]
MYQPRELVGLGWVLQAGATITLQVNGLLDFTTSAGIDRYDPDSVTAAIQPFLRRATQRAEDSGPDIYSFSVPGGPSGRFLLRDTATVVLMPAQPVHIQRLGRGLPNGFQVTTEDGVRYQYQAAETTHTAGEFVLNTYTSAWQLTRIISADNADTIRLHYSQHTQEPTPKRCAVTTGNYSTSFEGNGTLDGPYALTDCNKAAAYTWNNVITSTTTLLPQYLDSLTTRDTHVICQRDLATGVLRQVRVLATLDGRREIKRFTLFQSPFVGRNATVSEQRLRLDSLQEGANGLRLPPYRFAYNNDVNMPMRRSAAQDYWGYYNGADLNGGDAESPTGPALLADPRLGSLAANREPNFSAAVTGALIQVTYPTGGSTRWTYEANRIGPGTLEGQPTTARDTLQFETTVNYGPTHQLDPSGTRQVTYSDSLHFELTENSTVLAQLVETALNGDPNYKSRYRDFNLWRRETNGSHTLLTTTTPDVSSPELYYSVTPGQVSKRFRFALPPGRYAVQLYAEANESCALALHVPHTVSLTGSPLEGPTGGGIRVCQTLTRAPGAPPLRRTYEYLVPDSVWAYGSGLQLSGGRGYGYREFQNIYIDCSICRLVNTSSDYSQTGDEFNRYSFYYTCVTVRDSLQQGATVNYFTHFANQFNDVVSTKQLVYRQQGPRQQLAQLDETIYGVDSVATYPILRAYKNYTKASQLPTCPGWPQYTSEPFLIQTALTLPLFTRQVRYDEQGAPLVTLTRAEYRQQRLVRFATRTSTGWRIQRYKRLSDYDALPAVTALRVNHFNPIIETQTWQQPLVGLDSAIIAGNITLYTPRWRSPASTYQLRLDQPLLALNQESQSNGHYNKLLSDSRYERQATVRYAAGSGDLIEHQPTSGQPTSFLTGYAHTLVIAEAKNATYAQIAYTSFEATATGRWAYDSTGTHRVVGGRTGRYAYQLDGTAPVTRGQLPAGDYEVTYWAQGAIPTLAIQGGSLLANGAQLVATAPGSWSQYRARLRFTTTGQVSLSGATGKLDELRLYPVGAQLTSYTHEPLVGLSSQTGPDGRTTFFEYDGLGRLVRTRDEQGRILSQQQYHYAAH